MYAVRRLHSQPLAATGGQSVEVVRWDFWEISLEDTDAAGMKADLPFFLLLPTWDSGIMAGASVAILGQ